MKQIVLSDLMNILEYEKVRNEYRQDIMNYKKNRRISLGPNITITFENRKTMKFQIQEMMRAERMVHDHQIQEEVDVYNSLLPNEKELSATLFIEITEEEKIRTLLNTFLGLTDSETIGFEFGDHKIFAQFEEGREEEDKISSVHYIHFKFSDADINAFNDLSINATFSIHYNNYQFTEPLTEKMRNSLINDIL